MLFGDGYHVIRLLGDDLGLTGTIMLLGDVLGVPLSMDREITSISWFQDFDDSAVKSYRAENLWITHSDTNNSSFEKQSFIRYTCLTYLGMFKLMLI